MLISPLRYPGGKGRLFKFFAKMITDNNLFSYEYCEPYAGGAGLALKLLCAGFVERLSLNDIDEAVYFFWRAALYQTDAFCRLIEATPFTLDEWHRQKAIWLRGDQNDTLSLGFATYFLNRTNRSGIIEGAGPIGGYDQTGNWKIDVRMVKDKQIENLLLLARYRKQISIRNSDAIVYMDQGMADRNKFFYLDPPYYVKGRKLYKNFYSHEDHVKISNKIRLHRDKRWVISYDDTTQIREIYKDFVPTSYLLNYSAGKKGVGSEVMYFSDMITPPMSTT